jgi:2'-5' RNA ligase
VWLLLITPDAEPLVARWREHHDGAARWGVPAHITVRTPFLSPERWADPALAALEQYLPVTVTLARLEDRPGALVIVAEPDAQLREITDATTRTWPTLPPHKDEHRAFAYHVTVIRSLDGETRSDAVEAIAPHLPLNVTGTEMWAAAGSIENGLQHAVVAMRGAGQ